MHPSAFSLHAFGRCRLAAADARSVLRHLRGCLGACWGVLAPYLAPWLDDAAAAEARESGPEGASPGLRAAYVTAAERAARAGDHDAARTSRGSDVEQAQRVLAAEGPAGLGRLPRPLLGRPAIVALLRLSWTIGMGDPSLRLRLCELACDLADMLAGEPGEERERRHLRCEAAVERAAGLRRLGQHRAAQQQLDQVAEELGRRPRDPLAEAQLTEVQAALLGDLHRLRSARVAIGSAIAIYRQSSRREELARALIFDGNFCSDGGDYDAALAAFAEARRLIDPRREPVLAAAAEANSCHALLMSGRWREGLRRYQEQRSVIENDPSALNAGRFTRIEGRLLWQAGDTAGAGRAFAASYRSFTRVGKKYRAALTRLDHAALLERQGEAAGAAAMVREATGTLLELEPQGEVYKAAMLLRAASRFSAIRPALPLDRVLAFLDTAEFDHWLPLQPYLARA